MTSLLEVLNPYRGRKIAIYGLSLETENVLFQVDGICEVVGLLASYREDGEIYGKRIIPFSEAVKQHVALILVVARPGSCRTIAKKIGADCVEHQIDLVDVRGKNLCESREAVYDLGDMSGMTRRELADLFEQYAVISFDLFDTLIMRYTLFPTDVLEIVAKKLEKKGIIITDFSAKRQTCERRLSRTGSPTLETIYAYMLDQYGIESVSAKELAELEWETDYDLVLPRQELCDLISECSAHYSGEIYITSDTWYSKEQLKKILTKCGISFYTGILASCEFDTGKKQNLFSELKRRAGGRKCVHIGDNTAADIESAVRNGIPACKIHSAEEFLEQTAYFGMESYLSQLSCRIKIGLFAAKLWNSPFQFESKDRKIEVSHAYEIGYLVFGPMIADFAIWFREQVKSEEPSNIWFCARDGYLLKKMYDALVGDENSTYFLTSRTAAIRAGVQSEQDLYLHYSGDLEQQLWMQFGIHMDSSETQNKSLRDFKREILERGAVCRRNYLQYISSLKIQDGNIAFFDFVSKGTSQMFLKQFVENHLKGIYFFRVKTGVSRFEELDILSFYDGDEAEKSVLLEDFFILEPILTSPAPSVLEFDPCGKPVYEAETRVERELFCIQRVQDGIFDYFKTLLNVQKGFEYQIDKKLDEVFLSLIHRLKLTDEQFLRLKNDNALMNRSTAIGDLL